MLPVPEMRRDVIVASVCTSVCNSGVTRVGVTHSPGAATDGVTLFFLEKTEYLFSHRLLESGKW